MNPSQVSAIAMTQAVIRRFVACRDCGALHVRVPVRRGERAQCRRCGGTLYRARSSSTRYLLPLVITAMLLFITANTFPLVEIDLQGRRSHTSLWDTVAALWVGNTLPFAVLVFATTLLFPVVELGLLLYVAVAMRQPRLPRRWRLALRLAQRIRPWSMLEIYQIGIVVTLAKLAGFAHILPGIAVWCVGALTVVMPAAMAFDQHSLWRHLGRSTTA